MASLPITAIADAAPASERSLTPVIARSRRLRATPFSRRVDAAGVSAYTVYNHMLLPAAFVSLEDDYNHLKRHVQVWDVASERQVEVAGPDALALLKMVIPRDLSRIALGQCLYTPIVDERGRVLNDPVTIKLDDERYWVSIADSDIGLWLKGLAIGRGLRVSVHEPDVSPLAVQGPRADELMRRVFGPEVDEIRFFRSRELMFDGLPLRVARSGYSKQGGFEIYVTPGEIGEPLWDALFEAGSDLQVRPGGPNLIERVESGLLSYGNDMTSDDTLLECGLDTFCDFTKAPECIGYSALMDEWGRGGPSRVIRGLRIDGTPVPPCTEAWALKQDGADVGYATSAVWSPDAAVNVGIGMVGAAVAEPGMQLELVAPDHEPRFATVVPLA